MIRDESFIPVFFFHLCWDPRFLGRHPLLVSLDLVILIPILLFVAVHVHLADKVVERDLTWTYITKK